MVDIVEVRNFIKNGKLEVYVSKGKIYLRDTENQETVLIGNAESDECIYG